MSFTRAQKKQMKAKVLLAGTAGSGKTRAALVMSFGLVGRSGKIALLDTCNGMANIHAELGEFDVQGFDAPFTTARYIAAIDEAETAGYEVLIIDSLSPAWVGEGGLLEQVDKMSSGKGNKNEAWTVAQQQHNELIRKIQKSNLHIIATLKTKTEYLAVADAAGKIQVKKLGLAPLQRDGLDYDFISVFDLDQPSHVAICTTDHTGLFENFAELLEEKHGQILRTWLDNGVAETPATTALIGTEKSESEKETSGAEVKNLFINMEQLENLKSLMRETSTDLNKFLGHFKVDTLSNFPAATYNTAVAMLQTKKTEAVKKSENSQAQQQTGQQQNTGNETTGQQVTGQSGSTGPKTLAELQTILEARKIAFKVSGNAIVAKPAFSDASAKTFLKTIGAKWDSKEKAWRIAA